MKLRDAEAQREHTHGLQAVIVFMASFSRGQVGRRRVGERRGLREVVTTDKKVIMVTVQRHSDFWRIQSQPFRIKRRQDGGRVACGNAAV